MNRFFITILIFSTIFHSLMAESESQDSTILQMQEVIPVDSNQIINLLKNQLSSLREGEISSAYNDYTSKAFRLATSLEDFHKFVNHFEVLFKNKSLIIYAMYFENNTGTLQGLVTSESGESYKIEYDMIDENGQWKIIGIQLFLMNK